MVKKLQGLFKFSVAHFHGISRKTEIWGLILYFMFRNCRKVEFNE